MRLAVSPASPAIGHLLLHGFAHLLVLGIALGAHMHAIPLLGEEMQGKEELVVVHRAVSDGRPAEVAADDYSEDSGVSEEEGVLAEVDTVGVVREDFRFFGFEASERKGVTTDPR